MSKKHDFKVGDKVEWLGDPDGAEDLTIGKTYEVCCIDGGGWVVVKDDVCDRHARPAMFWRLADEPAPTNTKTISATVIYYPQTGRYTVYGTNEEEATSLVIADLVHDIEGHGPYQMFKLTAEVELPETKIFPAVVAPFEGENYD